MEILEKLKDQGWYLSEEAIKKLPENVDRSDPKKIIEAVMDMDLRGIGEGALPSEISKKNDSIAGRRVLQISRIRNISAPKSNEESSHAPRFLQLELTDGVNQVFALDFENIPSINLNTPPGTKIYLRNEKIPLMQGQLVLRSDDILKLGGKVSALIEKWEMAKTLQKYTKSSRIMSGSSGPPPWIPFGQKIQQNFNNDKNFKSLAGDKDKENKEKNEFDTMRNEAIAEAAKAGSKKIFGGGNQQLLDHNLKKIIEKGYPEEDAKSALRATKNNLEQALYHLKRRDEFKNKDVVGKRGFKDSRKSKSEEPISTKPAANVSLFDFFTDKLPTIVDTSDKNSSNKSERPKSLNHDVSKSSYHSQQSYGQHQNLSSHYQSVSNQQSQQKRDQPHNAQSQSSYQQQNHATYNHSNRPKFENNLSSSFANRNSTNSSEHDNYKNRGDKSSQEDSYNANTYSNRQKELSDKFRSNQRNSNYGQNQRPNERYSGPNYQKSSQPHSQQYNQQDHPQQPQQNQYQPKASGSNFDSRNRTDYQKRNGFDNSGKPPPTNSRYHVKETPSSHQANTRNYNDSRQPSNSNDNAKMNKLIEDTSKMKLDSSSSRMQQVPRSQSGGPTTSHQVKPYQHQQQPQPQLQQQHHQHQHQQQQQHHQQQQQQSVSQPAPHMQQRHPQHSQHQQVQPQAQPLQQHSIPPHTTYAQLPNGFTYDPNKIMGFQSKEANEFAMTLLKSQAVNAAIPPMQVAPHAPYPTPIQIPPQAFPATQFVMSQPAGPLPNAYSMGQCGENWNWKIGDRCIAKYWDDGGYYEAEVTGVSDKTCVVLFLGYGNHEEVLKSDCLPITDAQHRTINVSKLHEVHQQVALTNQPPPPQVIPQHAMSRGMHSGGRYRGERQMYVPPPKRDG